jgi:hypothetical protein
MTNPTTTETVIEQALVRAIEAIGTIEPSSPFERALAAALPGWVTEEILSASQHIGDDRAVVWFGEN